MSDERELVRSRVDLLDLVGQKVRLKKSGKNWTGLCPFHEDRNPSFSVSPDIGRYKCWSCGASGDAFTWVMETQGLAFRDALELLAKQVGIELTKSGPRQDKSKRQAMADAMEAAVAFFKDQLAQSSRAREYCESRGLDIETVAKWEIGYAPDVGDLLAFELKKKGFVLAEAKELSLLDGDERKGYYDRFRGRLMFPIRDDLGKAVAFGGRVIGDGHPKYINSSETPLFNKSKTFYGLDRAKDEVRKSKRAVVVEGYLDVIACHNAGVSNAIATLGTSLSEMHVKRLGHLCDEVVLLYDSDEAGQKAAERAIEMFMQAELRVKIALLEEGKDPDTLLRSHGPEAVQECATGGIEPVEFVIKRIGQRKSVHEEAYWSEVTEVLARLSSPLEVERYLMPLAQAYPFMRDPERAAKALRGMVRSAKRPSQNENVRTGLVIGKTRVELPIGLEAAPFRALLSEETRASALDLCTDESIFLTAAGQRFSLALKSVLPQLEDGFPLAALIAALEPDEIKDAFSLLLMVEDATLDSVRLEEVADRLYKRRDEVRLRSEIGSIDLSDEVLKSFSDRLKRLKGALTVPESSETEHDPFA